MKKPLLFAFLVISVGLVGLQVVRTSTTLRAKTSAARLAASGPVGGPPWSGPTGVSVTTAELMAQAAGGPRVVPVSDPADDADDTESVASAGRFPSLTAFPSDCGTCAPVAAAPPTLPTAQQVALSFTAMTGTGVPDTMGAIGPTQFLLVVNNGVTTFNKNTGTPDGVLNLALSSFFQPILAGGYAFDPTVKFDRLSGHWFVLAATSSTRLAIAVSASGTIVSSTAWTFFFIEQDKVSPPGDTGCNVDYPTWGLDANALYVTINLLPPCSIADGARIFVVRKSSVLGSGPVVASAFRAVSIAGAPVDNFDPDASVGYFVSAYSISRVTDPAGTPSLSLPIQITNVPFFAAGFGARHKGNDLETGSTGNGTPDAAGRMFLGSYGSKTGVIRNGQAWVATLTGVDNNGNNGYSSGTNVTRDGVAWLEIQGLDTSTPSIVQSGILYAPSATNDVNQRNYWMPALMASGQGHLVIGSSAAGTAEYINAAVAGRLADDPVGTMRMPVLFTASNSAYNVPPTNGYRRWGDYSAASLDPCDDMTVWTIQQYTAAANQWGVQVAKVLAPPPATPVSVFPAVLPKNHASLSVTVTGAQLAGAGFYDAGAAFACRLQAAFDGGVRVNTVTYNSPTSLTLNVSTMGVSTRLHGLTITNPDGQRVSVPAILSTGRSDEGDFDGDGKADITVFRPSNGTWYILSSGTGVATGIQWGNGADIPVPGDYDGDGKVDVAVFRPSTGTWFIINSSTGGAVGIQWGNGLDVPVQGDYDGDGRVDVAVFRPSNGTWYVIPSSTNVPYGVQWGNGQDLPVPGDYDGDGKTDIAVFRPSTGTWFVMPSSVGVPFGFQWGNGLDKPVPGDYDGDGKTDIAIFRPSTGTWYIVNSSTGAATGVQWGNSLDIPVPGDYDGDGRTDIAIFRPSNGTWFIVDSSTGAAVGIQWGNGADIPILKH